MKALALLLVLATAACALGDRIETGWHWGNWTVETGEELFWGSKHTSYPAMYLFDDDPKTAWVFSGLMQQDVERHGWGTPEDRASIRQQIAEEEKSLGSRFWITIRTESPVTLDGVEIMNGYNKSEEVFRKNRRVTGFQIWLGDHWQDPESKQKPHKTGKLPDAMGWHRINFPRLKLQASDSITIRLTDFTGQDSLDVALSGLRLLKKGKPIVFHTPEIVDFTTGAD